MCYNHRCLLYSQSFSCAVAVMASFSLGSNLRNEFSWRNTTEGSEFTLFSTTGLQLRRRKAVCKV